MNVFAAVLPGFLKDALAKIPDGNVRKEVEAAIRLGLARAIPSWAHGFSLLAAVVGFVAYLSSRWIGHLYGLYIPWEGEVVGFWFALIALLSGAPVEIALKVWDAIGKRRAHPPN